MIWRTMVFISAFSLYCYMYQEHGRLAASAASSAITMILIPLSEIERRLSALLKAVQS